VGPERATALLVHGFMDAGATWDLVAPTLAAEGLRVVAPDLRGFGETARVGAGGYYHFPDYVFDLADLVDQVAPAGPLLLVGHSMGGAVVTLYAGIFPERVTRLAVLEGVGPPDNGFELAPVRARRWIDDVRAERGRGERLVQTREEALRRLAAAHSNVDIGLLRERLHHLVRDVPGGIAWKHDPLHRTVAPSPYYARQWAEFARRVRCPTLFVDGGPQGYHPPDEAERLKAFAQLEQVTLPDAGHMLHWTRPAELAAALLAFGADL
jgi:pimeloyl-ACP methyl ester carboxylesterase